jgi:hypothetical protein
VRLLRALFQRVRALPKQRLPRGARHKGEHAHHRCHQFFWLICGAIKFEVYNSEGTAQIELYDLGIEPTT